MSILSEKFFCCTTLPIHVLVKHIASVGDEHEYENMFARISLTFSTDLSYFELRDFRILDLSHTTFSMKGIPPNKR